MRELTQEEIPKLPVQTIIGEDCVAFGVFDPGIVVQYLERDKCILIEWPDVIAFGSELLKAKTQEPVIEEIAAPTKVP